MGSTQNPDDRPYVVSRICSPARMRTKHRPVCPSCSAQARGHTSQRIRPSSRRVHQVVGYRVSATSMPRSCSMMPQPPRVVSSGLYYAPGHRGEGTMTSTTSDTPRAELDALASDGFVVL